LWYHAEIKREDFTMKRCEGFPIACNKVISDYGLFCTTCFGNILEAKKLQKKEVKL